jgi:hypothetical protein
LSAGAQYKALVEYAPHQRVPKPRSKKDVREGTITKGKLQMETWFLFPDMLGFSLIFRDVARGVNLASVQYAKNLELDNVLTDADVLFISQDCSVLLIRYKSPQIQTIWRFWSC